MTATRPSPQAARWETYLADRAGLSFSGSRGRWLRVIVESTIPEPGDGSPDASGGPDDEDALFERLCEALTVQESFFFREHSKLALLTDHVLPGYADRDRPIRVWSAGCAAGQEAYTLAMLLADNGHAGHYDILGTDLSPEAVAAAKRATYGRWSMRGVDAATVADHFEVSDEGYRVAQRYRERVRFAQHNLLEPMPPGTAPFDVIMCRNVLIYLTPEAVRRAAEAFSRALVPGGWLILGVSDPILDPVPGLQQVATRHGLAYRRLDAEPVGEEPVIAGTSGAAAERESRTAVRRTRRIRPRAPDPPRRAAGVGRVGQAEVSELVEAAERALELGKPAEAAALAGEAVERAPGHCPAHRALIQGLAEDGRLDQAAAAAARAMSAFPADALVRNLCAVVLLEQGQLLEAAALARQAVYLDPDLAVAHLVLARAREGLGDDRAASRARRNARQLLATGGDR